MGVCVNARMCVTFARMMPTHVNVKIHSAALYRPLVVKIAFHVHHFSIICWHSYFEKTTINVSKLPWCNRSSLTRWRCYGAPSPGIVGCFALYTRNLLLNTMIAHSIKQNPWHSKGIHPLTLKCTIWTDSEDMIRSLNQLHYITSDQSHSVKAT